MRLKQRNRISKPFMACRCRFCFHACRLAAPWLFGRLLTCYGQCELDSGIGLQQFLSLCTLEALEEEKPHLQAIHGMSVSILLSCVQTCSTMAVWKTCCLLWVMRAGFWLQACTVSSLEHVGSPGSRETMSPSHSWHVDIGINFTFVHADLQHHNCLEDLLLVVSNALCILASILYSGIPWTLWEP